MDHVKLEEPLGFSRSFDSGNNYFVSWNNMKGTRVQKTTVPFQKEYKYAHTDIKSQN